MGLEPSSLRLRVSCYTDWAGRAPYTIAYTRGELNNHLCATTLWNRYFEIINIFEAITNLNFVKANSWISRIKDIFLTNGKLKPWIFFSEKGLDLNNYLFIFGVSRAILESWRVLLNSGTAYMSLSNRRFGLYGFHRINFPLKDYWWYQPDSAH